MSMSDKNKMVHIKGRIMHKTHTTNKNTDAHTHTNIRNPARTVLTSAVYTNSNMKTHTITNPYTHPQTHSFCTYSTYFCNISGSCITSFMLAD